MGKIIDDDVWLADLHLTELFDLSDVEVTRDFDCSANYLTNLIGAPKTVGGTFYCQNNSLTSLEGAPTTVGDNFWCNDNNLTSLSGGPTSVGMDYDCSGNQLTNIEGMPKRIYGNIYLPLSVKSLFSITYVRSLSEIRGMVLYI